MYVAMKDLEIRGAGNLLGGEQSGHIAAVGFDLYVRLVGEAVAEFKGEAPDEVRDVKVELPVDAHLPHDYMPGERLRLEAYRKLAAVASDEELDAVRAELHDRYGEPPTPVVNLFEVARFRTLARKAGLGEVSLAGNGVRFGPVELRESQQLRLQRLYPGSLVKPAVRTILVPKPSTARVGGRTLRDVELLHWCRDLVAGPAARRSARRRSDDDPHGPPPSAAPAAHRRRAGRGRPRARQPWPAARPTRWARPR